VAGLLATELGKKLIRMLMPSPNAPPFYRCPNCKALYQVVRTKGGPETVNLEAACGICKGPFVAREGQFVLKYFLLRKAIREDSRVGRGSKQVGPARRLLDH
jgi:hypothetical protein